MSESENTEIENHMRRYFEKDDRGNRDYRRRELSAMNLYSDPTRLSLFCDIATQKITEAETWNAVENILHRIHGHTYFYSLLNYPAETLLRDPAYSHNAVAHQRKIRQTVAEKAKIIGKPTATLLNSFPAIVSEEYQTKPTDG